MGRTSKSELSKYKLHYEYHDDLPIIKGYIKRYKAKLAAKRRSKLEAVTTNVKAAK